MENENKIANEVEEVLNSIMDEINEEVAADEAAEEVVEEATEEVVEEAAEEEIDEVAEEVTEEDYEEADEEIIEDTVDETEEIIDEEEFEEMKADLTIKDNNSLYEEIVTTKKVEPFGTATNSVAFGALALLLPFIGMLFWVFEFRTFAFGAMITAFAFALVALIISFKARKFPATLSFEMSKAGRVLSIIGLVFSSLGGIYMVATIIKEIITTIFIVIVLIIGILYGGAIAPQWIETLAPMIEEYMAAMGY